MQGKATRSERSVLLSALDVAPMTPSAEAEEAVGRAKLSSKVANPGGAIRWRILEFRIEEMRTK
jgi:hypothetical protein